MFYSKENLASLVERLFGMDVWMHITLEDIYQVRTQFGILTWGRVDEQVTYVNKILGRRNREAIQIWRASSAIKKSNTRLGRPSRVW